MNSSNGLAPIMNSFGVTSSYFTSDKCSTNDVSMPKEAVSHHQGMIHDMMYENSFSNLIDYNLNNHQTHQFPSSSSNTKLTNL